MSNQTLFRILRWVTTIIAVVYVSYFIYRALTRPPCDIC